MCRVKCLRKRHLLFEVNCFGDRRIYKVFNFCSCEARRHLGQVAGVHFGRLCNFIQVQLEYVFAPFDVRIWHMNFLVKSSCSGRCWIQTIWVIGSSNNHDILILLETVHLRQDLVDSSSLRRLRSRGTPWTRQERVNLIYENNARCLLPCFFE